MPRQKNQLEKLEAAKSADLWLPFLTFPHDLLPFLNFILYLRTD